MLKWKLIHKQNRLLIENEQGKLLGYNPNSGIKIMEEDGFAFKDLNGNGKLDIMEDWRLPLKDRVEDFKKQYRIVQIDNTIYYKKGTLKFPQNIQLDIPFLQMKNKKMLKQILEEGNMDEIYLHDNYILVILLLMYDRDDDEGMQDYIIQTFIQGIEQGVLGNLMYSLAEAIQHYIEQHFHRECIQL